MRWFLRDKKIYIGPVTESQLDMLRATPPLVNGGIACLANPGKIDVYITVSPDSIGPRDLESIRLENIA